MFSCLTRQWNWFPTDWKFWDHLSLHRQCDQRRFSPSIVIRSCKRWQSSDLFSLTWRSTMTIPTKLSESNSTQYSYYIGIYCLFWASIDLYTLWIYTLHQPGGLPHWIASYCVHFPRSAKALDMDIGKLDDSYNKLTEVMAEGERDDYNVACLGSKLISQLLFFGQQIYSIYQWENLFESML